LPGETVDIGSASGPAAVAEVWVSSAGTVDVGSASGPTAVAEVWVSPAEAVDGGSASGPAAVAEVWVSPDGDDPDARNDVGPDMSAGEKRLDTGGPGKGYFLFELVYTSIKMPGSVSWYAPGKETVWSGVPVCDPLTRICVQDG
jgi:hypothetical protein